MMYYEMILVGIDICYSFIDIGGFMVGLGGSHKGPKYNDFGYLEEEEKAEVAKEQAAPPQNQDYNLSNPIHQETLAKQNEKKEQPSLSKSPSSRQQSKTAPNMGKSAAKKQGKGDGFWDRMKKWGKKHPILALGIAGAALIGTGGALTLGTMALAGPVAFPMMIGGMGMVAVAAVAGAAYGAYKMATGFYKWAKGGGFGRAAKSLSNLFGQSKAKTREVSPDPPTTSKAQGQKTQPSIKPNPIDPKAKETAEKMQEQMAQVATKTYTTPSPGKKTIENTITSSKV